jgi:hypothetical protein
MPPRDQLEEDAGEVLLALARAVAQLVHDGEVGLAQLIEDELERVSREARDHAFARLIRSSDGRRAHNGSQAWRRCST